MNENIVSTVMSSMTNFRIKLFQFLFIFNFSIYRDGEFIAVLSCTVAARLFAFFSSVTAQSSNIQVAVDQVDHLVGTFCPGTVSITCKGTYYTNLRWTYNGNDRIYIFESDNEERVYSLDGLPAFVSVELRQIEHYYDIRFANFTSVLIADLVQLDQLNISSISCGNPTTSAILPVSVSVQSNNEITLPNITKVIAVYNSTQLDSIQISWTKNFVSLTK